MKLKSLIAIAALTLFAQGAIAQPKSRIQAQAEAEKKAERATRPMTATKYKGEIIQPHLPYGIHPQSGAAAQYG